MSEFMPTTEEVRRQFTAPEWLHKGVPIATYDVFDRWLAEERRAAAEKAWDEGRESLAVDAGRPLGDDGMRPVTPNPYRAKETKA